MPRLHLQTWLVVMSATTVYSCACVWYVKAPRASVRAGQHQILMCVIYGDVKGRCALQVRKAQERKKGMIISIMQIKTQNSCRRHCGSGQPLGCSFAKAHA
jgi:hypothetical protein